MNAARRSLCLLVLIVLGLSGCGPKPSQAQTPVTVQLKWVHQAQFAGFYVAAEKGFYRDEGIDITLAPGGVGIHIVDAVISVQAQFGLIGAEKIIQARADGKAVKAIATIFRSNPFIIASLPESGIKKPEDLIGRVVNIGGTDGMYQFTAMMARLKLDINAVKIIPYNYDLEPFFSGEIDATPAIAAGSLIGILKRRPDVNLIWAEDYGIHFYSDTLFCADETIDNDADLVQRFVRATLKGERYVIENPTQAVQISLRYAVDADPETQNQMMTASIPLINTGEDQIGWMKAEVWKDMQDVLLAQGLIARESGLDEIFTTQFVEQIVP